MNKEQLLRQAKIEAADRYAKTGGDAKVDATYYSILQYSHDAFLSGVEYAITHLQEIPAHASENEAVSFAEWMHSVGCIVAANGEWIATIPTEPVLFRSYTTQQLYTLYKNQK